MAGRQGSSPLATGKNKGEARPSQTQLNSFFIDRSPEGRTKAQTTEQKLEVPTGPKQTAFIPVEKDRFSLAKFNEWLDLSLEHIGTDGWHIGSKTRLLVDKLLQKYSQTSVLHEKPQAEPNSQDQQAKIGRKPTTRATRARKCEEKENPKPKPEPAVVEDEKSHLNWVRKCLFKSLAKFVVLSYQYSWENKYRPSNADEVLNRTVAGHIKEWFTGYFTQKQEAEKQKAASGRKGMSDSEDDMAMELLDIEEITMAKRSQDAHESFMEYDATLEDNSLPKFQKKYACLMLVGRPGVGKTSAIEAISAAEGYTLKTIDCTMYESFQEIKKAYREAVRSMVVENKHTSQVTKASDGAKQPSGLMSFFSTMKPPPQQTTSVRSPPGEPPQATVDATSKPGSQPNSSHKEASTSENSLASSAVKHPKKNPLPPQPAPTTPSPPGYSQEQKVFLLQNVDRFFSVHEQQDKVFRSMLDFFEYSQFPFVLEVNKSGRNKIGDCLFEADLIEYTRPKGPRPAKALGIMADIEALKRFPSVRQIPRSKDGELAVPIAEGYNLLLKQALESFEAALQDIPVESLATSGGLCLEELNRLVEAYDYNLVSLGTYLQYYALKPDTNMFNKVAAGLQASLGPSLKEEYKPRPSLAPEIVLEAPNRDILQQNPISASCISTSDLRQTELMLKSFVAQLGLAAEHSDWDRFIDSGPQHTPPDFSILEAAEKVFMEQVSTDIKEALSKCCGAGTCSEPEFFNLLQLLKDCPPASKANNGLGLRFKMEKLANPLKLFFDQTTASEPERTALCRQLFKRFHRRSESVIEPRTSTDPPQPVQPEMSHQANPKRKNHLISDEENEAVL